MHFLFGERHKAGVYGFVASGLAVRRDSAATYLKKTPLSSGAVDFTTVYRLPERLFIQ